MNRIILTISSLFYCICAFALTEGDATSFIKSYYRILTEYAAAENVTLAKKIEGMHVGSGYVYPDVEINLGHGMTEVKGVGIKSVYLASIMSRQNLLLKFVPNNLILLNNSNGICTIEYTLFVYSGNEQPGRDVLKYTVPLKMEIQNSDKKIRSILKTTRSTRPEYTLSANPTLLTFDASGGSRSISVNSNTNWEISVNTASWGHLTTNGNTITLRVDPYNGSSDRTDYFKIKAGDKEVKIDIRQSAPIVEMSLLVDGSDSDKTKYFTESGGRETYYIRTTASSYETWGVPSWCKIENKTSSSFTLVCEQNPSTSQRSDYMKVKAGGKEIRIDIKQDGKQSEAIVENCWLTHNLTKQMWNGFMWVNVAYMRIHCHFSVAGHLKEKIRVCAFFHYPNGNKVYALNNEFRTSDGQATVQGTAVCTYSDSLWKDYTLDIPYYALPKGSLKVVVQIQDKKGSFLAESSEVSFQVY